MNKGFVFGESYFLSVVFKQDRDALWWHMKQMPNIVSFVSLHHFHHVWCACRSQEEFTDSNVSCRVTSRPKHFRFFCYRPTSSFVIFFILSSFVKYIYIYIYFPLPLPNLPVFTFFHIWRLFLKNGDFEGGSRDFLREGFGNTAGNISFTDLLPLCSHVLIIIALPGFLYFYTFTWCFFTQNHHFYSFPTDLHDLMMSINSYYALISLYEWMAEMRVFLYHTHTLKRAWRSRWSQRLPSQWGHKHTNIISRTALRVTSSAFHRFIWVKLASYHIQTELLRYSRQPVKIKVRFNLKTLQQKYITIVQQNVHSTYYY